MFAIFKPARSITTIQKVIKVQKIFPLPPKIVEGEIAGWLSVRMVENGVSLKQKMALLN